MLQTTSIEMITNKGVSLYFTNYIIEGILITLKYLIILIYKTIIRMIMIVVLVFARLVLNIGIKVLLESVFKIKMICL